MLFYVIMLLVFSLSEFGESDQPPKKLLLFSYITSINATGFTASGGIPLVDMALESINNRSDLLANYTLNYTTIEDSKVRKGLLEWMDGSIDRLIDG